MDKGLLKVCPILNWYNPGLLTKSFENNELQNCSKKYEIIGFNNFAIRWFESNQSGWQFFVSLDNAASLIQTFSLFILRFKENELDPIVTFIFVVHMKEVGISDSLS